MADRRWKMGILLSPISYLRSPHEAMINIQWNPDRKQLRQFAAIWFPAFCALLGWIIGKKTGDWGVMQMVWLVCGVQALVGILYPPAIRPMFIGLILLTYPIGWVVSHVLLGAIFFLLVTPIGLVLRVTGHDPLQLKATSCPSLWKTSICKTDPASYLRQS